MILADDDDWISLTMWCFECEWFVFFILFVAMSCFKDILNCCQVIDVRSGDDGYDDGCGNGAHIQFYHIFLLTWIWWKFSIKSSAMKVIKPKMTYKLQIIYNLPVENS